MFGWLPPWSRKSKPPLCSECGYEIAAGEQECWYANERLHIESACRQWRRDTAEQLEALKRQQE